MQVSAISACLCNKGHGHTLAGTGERMCLSVTATNAKAPALQDGALQSCILPSPHALVLALRLGSAALGIPGYPSSFCKPASLRDICIYQATKKIKKGA